MGTGTVFEVVLLALGAVCFLLAVLAPGHPYAGRFIPLGLLLWITEVVLAVSGALPGKGA